MRHGKKDNHLGRTASHRSAMLSNMAASLILSKRIQTTLAKAKELRKYAEPLINRSKDDTTHSRRVVFGYLQNKEAVKELFGVVAEKVRNSPAGTGLNAATGEYEDLLKAGVADPVKVTRSALQNAASIAGLFLTTEAVVADKPEKAAAPAGDPTGGMGGMDF